MLSILETVLPIFGLVLCGYVVGRRGWMSEEAIKGLNTFVFYFAVPALLFRAMARGLGPIEFSIVGAYFSAVVVTFLLALPVAGWPSAPGRRSGYCSAWARCSPTPCCSAFR